eukprot:TRINITY_DN39267_c0_g1_i1.p1 TRINITY_DN39267_c0_g1~~TRINITY_DN39267_c0_g1_i1.p1  ORF type:complete len:607 (+),score=145.77 TRINITY_DN39267_c0_g1_i1:51-1871(+)
MRRGEVRRHADPAGRRIRQGGGGRALSPVRSYGSTETESTYSDSTPTETSSETESESTDTPSEWTLPSPPRRARHRVGSSPSPRAYGRHTYGSPRSSRDSRVHLSPRSRQSVGRTSRAVSTARSAATTRASRRPSEAPSPFTFRPVITKLAQKKGEERAADANHSAGGEGGKARWEDWQYYEQMTRRAEKRRAQLRGEGDLTAQNKREIEEWLECTFAPKVNSTKDKHCTAFRSSRTQKEVCEELYHLHTAQQRRQNHRLSRSGKGWRVEGDPSTVDVTTAEGKEWVKEWRSSFKPDLRSIHRGMHKSWGPPEDSGQACRRLYEDAHDRVRRREDLVKSVHTARERDLERMKPPRRPRSPRADGFQNLYERGVATRHCRASQGACMGLASEHPHQPNCAGIHGLEPSPIDPQSIEDAFDRLYMNDSYARKAAAEDPNCTFQPERRHLPEAIRRENADYQQKKERSLEAEVRRVRRERKEELRKQERKKKHLRRMQKRRKEREEVLASPASPPRQPKAHATPGSSPRFQGFMPRKSGSPSTHRTPPKHAQRPPLPPQPAAPPSLHSTAEALDAGLDPGQPIVVSPLSDDASSGLSHPDNVTDEDLSS